MVGQRTAPSLGCDHRECRISPKKSWSTDLDVLDPRCGAGVGTPGGRAVAADVAAVGDDGTYEPGDRVGHAGEGRDGVGVVDEVLGDVERLADGGDQLAGRGLQVGDALLRLLVDGVAG